MTKRVLDSEITKMAKLNLPTIFPKKNTNFSNHSHRRDHLWKSKSTTEKFQKTVGAKKENWTNIQDWTHQRGLRNSVIPPMFLFPKLAQLSTKRDFLNSQSLPRGKVKAMSEHLASTALQNIAKEAHFFLVLCRTQRSAAWLGVEMGWEKSSQGFQRTSNICEFYQLLCRVH